MLDYLIDVITCAKENGRLREACAKLLRECAQDKLTIATLQAENRQLRRRLDDVEMRLVRRAQQDALLMGGLFFADLPVSRRACAEVGIGHRRWVRAVALLRVARVHDGARISVQTPDDYERGVKVAVERVKRDGLESLKHRMPLYSQ